MKRIFRIAVLLLLALWLPATLHCDLEAAGLAPASMECRDEHADAAHADDNCDVVENGIYKAASATLKIFAPTLLAAGPCPSVALPAPPVFIPPLAPERTDSPPELTRTWQFLARAALPARAPGLNA